MKFLRIMLAAVAIAFAFQVLPAAAQVGCDQTAVYDASTNGSTKLVTGTASTRIFVCGYTLTASAGSVTAKFVTGTGTNCGTGEAALTPAFPMTAQTVVTDSSPSWRGLTAQPGLDMCIKTSAGVAVQALVYFSQR